MIVALLLSFACVPVDDLAALDKKLHSTDDRERRAAVIDLAKLDSKDGWTRVIGALEDVSSQVGDEAEIQLAKVHALDTLTELCGKRGLTSKNAWVAVHAAGAIGSLSGIQVPAALVSPALTSKSEDVKRILCASIEKLVIANQIGEPEKLRSELTLLTKGEDGEVRAAALMALVKLPKEAPASVADLVHEHDPAPVTCALLQIARDSTDEKTRTFIGACSRSADRSVRAQVVEDIATKPDAKGLGTLVAMLEVESNKRLADTIDAQLERLSGLTGGGKATFWREWVDHLGSDWKPVTHDAKPRESKGDTTVALAGMPIVSDHVAILVDFSGSTWKPHDGGKTRKDRLDVELKKTLEALPATTSFNVIPFTDVPIPWEKSLQPATPANVARALKFFTSCKSSGKGNFWDAAMLALESPDVDTILVLTDGAPTGGHRWNIDLMRERFVERNRFRHVTLDAVIVDAKKGMQERWRKFCEATGGRMLAVDL